MNAQLSEFNGFNKVSVSVQRILWESVKGFIRSFSISFASNLNKNHLQEINKLEKKLSLIESAGTARSIPLFLLYTEDN